LRLERLEDPEALAGLHPSEAGKIAHLILKSLYEELSKRDFFSPERAPLDSQALLKAIADQAFRDYELDNPVGYAVAWEIFREDLTELLSLVVQQDLSELTRQGYRPIAFEKEINSRLSPRWEAPLGNLPIQGKLDRIDFMAAENRYRVIDYKLKMGGQPTTPDKNLPLAAVRGQRLQAPFYILLARELLTAEKERAPEPEIEAAFYFLARGWRNGPLATACFPADGWDGETGRQLKQTLALLLKGIDQGLFFIQPGSYCRNCAVSEVCRKNHLPTRWRADGDPQTALYRELSRKKLLKGNLDEEEESVG
jgi:ATP-dependent helicase/nuclease subunit B